jgi:hypothetical protein
MDQNPPNLRDPEDPYFQNNFNTKLSPAMEAEFQRQYPDPKSTQDYDLRGAWQNGISKSDDPSGRGHLPDTFKKPNSPTFSDESIYHGTTAPFGGTWQGGKWEQSNGPNWSYTPSTTMLKYTHDPIKLQEYMKKYESNAELKGFK